MGTVPAEHWVFTSYRTHAEGNTNTMHLTLGVPTHKSPSVGEVGEQITCKFYSRSILVYRRISSGLLIKKRKKKREKKREKEKKKV